jgi:hypothetical protein
MNKNLFNQLVRPCVSVIPLGKRAIASCRRAILTVHGGPDNRQSNIRKNNPGNGGLDYAT